MNAIRPLLAACAFAVVAGVAIASAPQGAPAVQLQASNSDQLSAAKRKYPRRPAHHQVRHYESPRYSSYLRGSDPSLGPDGLPYRVPAHLRNQCYIDEGYGRFSACPSR